MRNEFTYDKQELRRVLLKRRAKIEDRSALSQQIAERVLPMLSGNVLVYISIGSEVDTNYLVDRLLRRDDVTVFAPYTSANGNIAVRKLRSFGIADKLGNLDENCYCDIGGEIDLDFCVTPLVGFNDTGHRIGYGKGCYDRFFSNTNVVKIGLAFDAQHCEFKSDMHDIPLDRCITESKVLYFKTCE